MKETEHNEEWKNTIILTADEQETLTHLSELIQRDGLRYERRLEAEEEVNEL